MVSKRALSLIDSPSEIVTAHIKCMQDPYSLENKNGYLNYGTAQNYLMTKEINQSLKTPITLTQHELHYNEAYGMNSFREVLSSFLETFLNIQNIKTDNIVVQTGASAVCESLSFSLFDKGDTLLIPSPYYLGFNHDFAKRFGVDIEKVYLNEDDHFRLDKSIIEKTYATAKENGKNVKAILITNPHNPSGQLRSNKELEELVEFAKEYKLEIISDEIYALSTYEQGKYKSILDIAPEYREHIHFIYGMAKDITLSGFKVGIYYSENTKVLEAMQAVSYFHTVSTHTQKYFMNLLSNNSFMESFIKTNKKRLNKLATYLKENIPYPTCNSDSGIFFLLNLKSLLKEATFEEEFKLFEYLINQKKTSITPGQFFEVKEPGWFRVCFAQPHDEAQEFIKRINTLSDY